MNEADVSKWAKRHNLDLFPSELKAMISDALQLFGTSEPAAQRPWVGLTAAQRKEIERQSVYVDGAIRMTEASLKDKNT